GGMAHQPGPLVDHQQLGVFMNHFEQSFHSAKAVHEFALAFTNKKKESVFWRNKSGNGFTRIARIFTNYKTGKQTNRNTGEIHSSLADVNSVPLFISVLKKGRGLTFTA